MVRMVAVALLAVFAAVTALTGFKMLREIAEFERWRAGREPDVARGDERTWRPPDEAA